MEDKKLDPKTDEPKSAYAVMVLNATDRNILDHYKPFIYSKWLRSLRAGNDYFKLVHPAFFYAAYKKYIAKFFENPKVLVRIAVLKDDYDVILGFAIKEGSVLHYVYVDKLQRKQGIGQVLAKDFDSFTHLTHMGITIWNEKYKEALFNPFQ